MIRSNSLGIQLFKFFYEIANYSSKLSGLLDPRKQISKQLLFLLTLFNSFPLYSLLRVTFRQNPLPTI